MGVDIGKRLMANRKPYNMKRVSALHNTFMFSLSLYMVIETMTQAWINFNWGDNLRPWGNVTESGAKFSPSGYRLARVIWIHYISKAYEFVDTLIMILRKNERQITFLHVYHHASTFFPCWWSATNFAPGGDVYFICALNSFVHVLMYGYYLATCLGWKAPQVIKKSITTVQMVQFALLNFQAFYGVFWATWYRPRIVVVLAIIQSVVFMCLFYNFMRKAYSGTKQRSHPKIIVEDSGVGVKDE
ncbi:hypothetical protein WJX73_003990 [Symbiochloris irregularis]|uniref:Very-long-chain 3-oxoacyl-CoA synthase n=1 Tax=Symbiochloris irregularis TaxID=706552 RepID=A0AAW1PLI8_9CHLO